jgi:hypothetical protein
MFRFVPWPSDTTVCCSVHDTVTSCTMGDVMRKRVRRLSAPRSIHTPLRTADSSGGDGGGVGGATGSKWVVAYDAGTCWGASNPAVAAACVTGASSAWAMHTDKCTKLVGTVAAPVSVPALVGACPTALGGCNLHPYRRDRWHAAALSIENSAALGNSAAAGVVKHAPSPLCEHLQHSM